MNMQEPKSNAAGGESSLTGGLCGDDDHEWEYKEDVIGDYGVINGTYIERRLECSICGATKPATYEDAPTFDDDY